MTERHSEVSTATVAALESPGSLLRAKRKERGFSMLEAAQSLRLSVRQMQALENDDYDNLPGQTYILGYWRNYACMLGISIDPAIAAHKKNLLESMRRPGNDHAASTKQPGIALSFALIAVVFLASIWYLQAPAGPSSPPARTINGEPTLNTEIASLDALIGQIEKRYGRRREAERDAGQYANRNQHHYATQPEPNFEEENGALRFDADAPDSERFSTASVPGEDAQAADASTARTFEVAGAAVASIQSKTTPSTSTSSSLPATPSLSQIVFLVEQESWIEVRDGAGQRLIARAVNGGQRVALEGTPPFAVFVGNIEGVAVEYQGKLVPFVANGNRLFARFNLGAPR